MSKIKSPEQIFYDDITKLIKNLLVENPNYTNGYYHKDGRNIFNLYTDTKERAKYILEKMDDWKHLINIEDQQ